MTKRQYETSDYKQRCAKALKLHQDGYHRTAIAERFGVSPAEASRMINDARHELNRVPATTTPESANERTHDRPQ